MEIGIIGAPRSGKTSLFNAVTRGSARIGVYSSGDTPNVGVVHVPDERVDALAAVFHPKRSVYADIRWVDFPVAGFGADGPGSRFLADIANLDAIVHVVRAFEDESVPHDEGSVDAQRDLEALELELTFADLGLIETRLKRIEAEARALKAGARGDLERDRALLERVQAHLEGGQGLRSLELSEAEGVALRNYQFVTRPPVLFVVNIGEDDLGRAEEIERQFAASAGEGASVAALCAKVEAELAQMEPEEALEFRSELGLPAVSPLDRAIQVAYELLGLQSFLTVGEDECRAWPVRRGASAPEAAGKVHSDIERGFIRAEIAGWREIVDAGSMAEVKRRGQLRTEGKSYLVQDGDVINFLFNV